MSQISVGMASKIGQIVGPRVWIEPSHVLLVLLMLFVAVWFIGLGHDDLSGGGGGLVCSKGLVRVRSPFRNLKTEKSLCPFSSPVVPIFGRTYPNFICSRLG